MVQVELQRNIRLRDRIDDRERLLRGRQDVARIIASVERLDQQRDARSRAAHRRTPQIRDQGRFVRSRRYSIDTPARHRVQPRASTRRCIGEGLVERSFESAFIARARREAPFAGREVAGREIDQREFQPGRCERRRDIRRGDLVRIQDLDGAKSEGRRGRKTIEQRQFGEEPTEVRCELRH